MLLTLGDRCRGSGVNGEGGHLECKIVRWPRSRELNKQEQSHILGGDGGWGRQSVTNNSREKA